MAQPERWSFGVVRSKKTQSQSRQAGRDTTRGRGRQTVKSAGGWRSLVVSATHGVSDGIGGRVSTKISASPMRGLLDADLALESPRVENWSFYHRASFSVGEGRGAAWT